MRIHVGYYQFWPNHGSVEHNVSVIEDATNRVQCDLLVFPELSTTGYLFDNPAELHGLAEEIPAGKSVTRLRNASRRSGISLVIGLAERHRDRLYNSSLLITPDGNLGLYRKVHLFDREKSLFRRGNLGFPVFAVQDFFVGMMICFDWIFPEACRTLALRSADLIAHPANLVLPYCPDAMITRAIENRVYTVTCNRIGEEQCGETHLRFIGSSRIVSPSGNVIAGSDGISEDLRVEAVEPDQSRNKWITDRNHLFDDRLAKSYRISSSTPRLH